jgi:hypothetical protein
MSTTIVTPSTTTTTVTSPAVPSTGSSTIDKIFSDVDIALGIAASIGASFPAGVAIAGAAGLLQRILSIAEAAVKAHEALAGVPLDLTVLKQLPPLA